MSSLKIVVSVEVRMLVDVNAIECNTQPVDELFDETSQKALTIVTRALESSGIRSNPFVHVASMTITRDKAKA